MTIPLRALVLAAALAGAAGPSAAESLVPRYLHNLADFGGPVPFMGVRLQVDDTRNEVYVLDGRHVRVFGPSGMEVFSFGISESLLAGVYDLELGPSGDVFVLGAPVEGGDVVVQRFSYRGEPRETIAPRLPAGAARFLPTRLVVRDGRFTLVSLNQFRAVVLRADGSLEREIDLAPLLEIADSERSKVEIGDVAIDPAGRMIVSLPAKFLVYVITPDGKSAGFGKVGSTPGDFSVVGGVAGDAAGHIYVADKQRSVVLVFDSNYRFLTEFGGYGDAPENLVRPDAIDVSTAGRVYVTQMRKRGVSVYAIDKG